MAYNKVAINSMTYSIPFIRYAYIVVSLPLGSLFFCLITAVIYQYDEVNETVCNVTNFVPSISAITGVFPQAFIWRLCIALQASPRLLSVWMYYNFYLQRINHISPNRQTIYRLLLRLNFWLHLIENFCLCSVAFISNKENYPVHERVFIVFMVSSLCYMALNTYLYHWSSSKPLAHWEQSSYKGKTWFLGIALTSTAALLVAFYLHRAKCVPLAFSFFSVAEYFIAVSSTCYHMTAIYEFSDNTMCVATLQQEHYCNAFSFFSVAEYFIAVSSMCYHMTAIYEFSDNTMCVATLQQEDYCNGDVPVHKDGPVHQVPVHREVPVHRTKDD